MTTTAEQWAAAIGELDQAHRHKFTEATLRRIRGQVRRFGADMAASGIGPWDPTPEQIDSWLDDTPDSTRYAHRAALRTFYRWAARVGRVQTDPTEPIVRRCRPRSAPTGWAGEIDAFLRHLRAAGRPETTISQRRHQLQRLAHQTGQADPWTMTTDDLADWVARHRWSLETRRAHRAGIRAFYAWAHETGRIDHDPAARLPMVKAAHPAPRPASEDAYAAALARAGDRERLMLRLAAELGMRRGEVAQVHSADLTRQRDGWWLHVRGKGGRPRTIPVPDGLAEAIRQRGAGYVFPGQDQGHLSAPYVGRMISQLLPAGVSMHALRHRFATRAYAVDRNVLAVQQLLGHVDPNTTQRYVQIPSSDLRRLVG
ncbi:tyrosine-type recombinase/integrase [Ammonicoccus fulvus]|uniref:Tyrosine-type recombinase/integrase n=1 Tax=Ammonicoccus fulvus TaxID=3138240 RepID=A0ABZ3FSW9_9ACTN